MAEEQARSANHAPVENQGKPVATAGKKKASWFRTILWMLSMMVLANVVMAIIAYILYRYKII